MDYLKELCISNKLLKNKNLKYTESELFHLLDVHIKHMAKTNAENKERLRKLNSQLGSLSEPVLWKFKTPLAVPPDFRAEYLRRLSCNEPVGPVTVVKQKKA